MSAPTPFDTCLLTSANDSTDEVIFDSAELQVETDRVSDLCRAVKNALEDCGYHTLRRVDVEICSGVVVLWGEVPTYHMKQIAQTIAHSVPGVRAIANGLDVVCFRGNKK